MLDLSARVRRYIIFDASLLLRVPMVWHCFADRPVPRAIAQAAGNRPEQGLLPTKSLVLSVMLHATQLCAQVAGSRLKAGAVLSHYHGWPASFCSLTLPRLACVLLFSHITTVGLRPSVLSHYHSWPASFCSVAQVAGIWPEQALLNHSCVPSTTSYISRHVLSRCMCGRM